MSQPIGTTSTNTTPGSHHEVVTKTRYTRALDTTGWLRVKLEPSGASVYLCEFVKVTITKENERTYFMILEGPYKGKMASLTTANATKCLTSLQRGTGAKIVAKIIGRKKTISVPRGNEEYNQLLATLIFNGLTATITLDSDVRYREENLASPHYQQVMHSKPLPKGTYKILAPEFPKDAGMTNRYTSGPGSYPDLKYHTAWFPIENPATLNSNFVHVGHLSEGCVTMYELEMWNPLYLYLISNRMDKDGKYVGTLIIE